MVAHFARRVLLAIICLCIVYNVILVQFIPTKTYTALGTGSKRLFYAFRPPTTPHRVISLADDHVAIFMNGIFNFLVSKE